MVNHNKHMIFILISQKLTDDQLQNLLTSTKVDNPLWMSLMCEELRIFGDFRMMDKKLEGLPSSMDKFLANVVDRLINEDETGYVKKVSISIKKYKVHCQCLLACWHT